MVKYILHFEQIHQTGLTGLRKRSDRFPQLYQFWSSTDIPQVTEEENEILTANFIEKEVCDAVFQMKHNKAPGPDGFPTKLYQVFWSLIKDDLMAMFRDFHSGDLPLFSLNFGIITLIPK